MLTGSEIRRKFLDFFVQKGHREVHSSSLVPANDPHPAVYQCRDEPIQRHLPRTGRERDYNRATTSQKCVRAGGKHNDLENVGFTNRHHTFFEMLGNFSFGDYFKKDAIAYAWELITSPEWFGIEKGKLYVTIFNGEGGVPRDAEAYDLWVGQGVKKDRIFEAGLKDNFWQMGDTGPCGPCSDSLRYGAGGVRSGARRLRLSVRLRTLRRDLESGVHAVRSRFERQVESAAKTSIDTGMGLERVTAVLQGVISNYDTDLFTPLIKRAAELTGHEQPGLRPGQAGRSPASTQAELAPNADSSSASRGDGLNAVLAEQAGRSSGHKAAASAGGMADQSRAATFLISDGVLPSNEGRGYVLRKIIRRAITHGRLLGQKKPFLHEMVFAVRDLMEDAYPELKETIERVERVVLVEESRFARTLDVGLEKLEVDLANVRNQRQGKIRELTHGVHEYQREHGTIPPGADAENLRILQETTYPGELAFKLYDTFGMPLDFMQDAAHDQGIVSIKRVLIARCKSSASVLAPHGKAQPSRLPIRPTSSFRNPSSRAIAKRVPIIAKCWPSSVTGKARRNSSPERKARSSSITRLSMRNLAGKSAIADGFTATTTTR